MGRKTIKKRTCAEKDGQSAGSSPVTVRGSFWGSDGVIALGLILITAVAYVQVFRFGYVDYDDYVYVVDNVSVNAGLTFDGLRWAFTTGYAGNWHPLTWLSHMLDVALFGLNPGAHHLVNVLFHAVNVVMLFLLLRRTTSAVWRSAFVAALFAVHPLHVESVAWISERKDVLSTLFWLLTTGAYVRYAKHPGRRMYVAMIVLYALGLMAKPMLVTLPFTLLLLDYWPLNRFTTRGPDGTVVAQPFRGRIVEKVPLFLLMGASCVVTILVQSRGGAVAPFDSLPLLVRAENAVVVFVRYILMMVWPTGLAACYPHPGFSLPSWHVAVSSVTLIVITAGCVIGRRAHPYLPVGWLWYVGTLVPVIGIVQVGVQALADRYTYVPSIGLFIIIAWGAHDLGRRCHFPRYILPAAGTATLVALVILTAIQTCYWKSTLALFGHAISVTKNNYVAHKNLGVALSRQGRTRDAFIHGMIAMEIQPKDPELRRSMESAFESMRKTTDSFVWYEKASVDDPRRVTSDYDAANALAKDGHYEEAVSHYSKVIEQDPAHLGARINMGNALCLLKKPHEAEACFTEALRIDPICLEGYIGLGNVLNELDRVDEAISCYQKGLERDPNQPVVWCNLAFTFARQGRFNDATRAFERTLQLNPDDPRAVEGLKIMNSRQTLASAVTL